MKASSVLALAGLAAATPLTVQVNDNAPDPTQVRIRSVGYAGTGCPQGSAYTSISENARTVTVLFDSYVATVGAGAAPSAQRRACTLQIELTYPSGYSFNVLTVRTQGYVNTDPGVTGQVVNKYFFSGVPGIATSTTNIPGNTHGNWAKTDSLNAAASVYAPCGGDGVVNMQTSVALQQQVAGANGYISADSIDASFQQKFRQDYGLGWDTSRCNNGGNTQPAGPLPVDPSAGIPAPFPAPAPYSAPAPVPVPVAAPAPYRNNPFNPYASNPYAPSPYASSNPYTTVGSTFGSPFGGNPFGGFSGSPFGFPFSGYQATTTSGITAPLTASSDD